MVDRVLEAALAHRNWANEERQLLSLAKRCSKNLALDAEDLLQNAWLAAVRYYDAEKGDLPSFLRCRILDAASDERRKAATCQGYLNTLEPNDTSSLEPSASEKAAELEASSIVDAVVTQVEERLFPVERDVFRELVLRFGLRSGDRRSQSQLGVSRKSKRLIEARCHQMMRALLTRLWPDLV